MKIHQQWHLRAFSHCRLYQVYLVTLQKVDWVLTECSKQIKCCNWSSCSYLEILIPRDWRQFRFFVSEKTWLNGVFTVVFACTSSQIVRLSWRPRQKVWLWLSGNLSWPRRRSQYSDHEWSNLPYHRRQIQLLDILKENCSFELVRLCALPLGALEW